jgi:RNA polymerase sigma factor FliA
MPCRPDTAVAWLPSLSPPTRRERFVVRHLSLVRRVARTLRRRVPDLELEDLVSAGTIGLIEAVDRYEAGRGVAFSTFAYLRIRGAMLDEARRERRHVSAAVGTQAIDTLPLLANPLALAPGKHAELNELLRELGELPPRERGMLVLHAQGYSVSEIAALDGCSDARASQLLTQARLRLEQRTAA